MWWECGECGAHLMRERPPAVCRECGRAGATFVELSRQLDPDADFGSRRDAWLRAGVESGTFRLGADRTWADSAA